LCDYYSNKENKIMEEKTFQETMKELFEQDKENLGIIADMFIGSLIASILFHSEEDINLYRLGGTLKESPYITFYLLNF